MFFSWIYLDSTLQELFNCTNNTKIKVRMTKLWSYEVGAKIGELQQRRNVENQRCDVAESAKIEHPDAAQRRRDVRGWFWVNFLAHFEPIIGGFKAQTHRRRGRRFLGGLEGGKHLRAWFSLGKKMD